jgi:large conductance mechanosensitive channel
MWKEFRDFLFRGNVIALAVAVVIGAAFGAVITSFVKDILTPLLGLLGIPDFSTAAITVGSAQIRYGLFLNALITFILVAAAIFFFVVRPMDRMEEARKRGEPDAAGPSELSVLEEIRDELKAQRPGTAPGDAS